MPPILPRLAILLLWVVSHAFAAEPIVLITAPDALRQIEQKGYSLGERIADARFASASTATLYAKTAYRDIVDEIAKDLKEFSAEDFRLGVGMHKSHRLFDIGWLKSPDAHFELIGVSNRLDRRPFNRDACGEIRFVYRLAYKKLVAGQHIASRLPMTVSVIMWALDETGKADCNVIAKRWLPDQPIDDTRIGEWALKNSGPLALPLFSAARIKSIEINFQSVRWPSTIRGDMAGHAEYVLRVFTFAANRKHLRPTVLENTPDVDRLSTDPTARKKLLAWLRQPEQLNQIDTGTVVLPTDFLAKRAISVAPRGFARLANRPFKSLFKTKDFAGLELAGRKYISSPAALLRRLDDMSCMGCHQARSVAGFHLLGQDPQTTVAGNALALATSPHVAGDLGRRAHYVAQLAATRMPADDRPLSERSPNDNGFGAHCGLNDAGFASWRCANGLICQPNPDDESDLVGRCLPQKPVIGGPCEPGTVIKNTDSHRDTVQDRSVACELSAVCETNHVGFPGGMCAGSCSDAGTDVVCGGIARLTPFNQCLAQEKPFADCLEKHVSPAGLRMCDASSACRDDYICARTPSGKGACIPPYFIFQMRVDGHPASGPR